MQVDLIKWQTTVWDDPHRYKVLVCGRRAGKTTLCILKLIHEASQKVGKFPWWYGAPTYRQAKQIAWNLLKTYAVPGVRDPKYDNETELSIRLMNGSQIALKGFDNPKSLEGVGLEGIVVDEVSAIHNWDDTWDSSVRPMLTDVGGWAWFVSKPRGFNHFHTLAKRGDWNNIIEGESKEKKDPDYITYRFTTYDNPHIPKEEIERAKQETKPDYFNQEYLARFTKYTGLVYKEFDRDVHVLKAFPIPESWSHYRGVDFGYTNPFACLWIAVDNDDNWFVYQELYEREGTIDYLTGHITALTSRPVVASYADPSDPGRIEEFARRNVFLSPAVRESGAEANWLNLGIGRLNERLRSIPGRPRPYPETAGKDQGTRGYPKVFVFSNCENTIREFEAYCWRERRENETQDLNEPETPEKANDHAMDALRYFATSYQKRTTTVKMPEKKDWRIGR